MDIDKVGAGAVDFESHLERVSPDQEAHYNLWVAILAVLNHRSYLALLNPLSLS
jgi:hypothetical protein